MAESLARAGWTVFFVALASFLGETARVLPLAAICFFGGAHFFGMAPSYGEAFSATAGILSTFSRTERDGLDDNVPQWQLPRRPFEQSRWRGGRYAWWSG
jgi:hypothetical protein